MTKENFIEAFKIPGFEEQAELLSKAVARKLMSEEEQPTENWMCVRCTLVNSMNNKTCVGCEYGWDGQRRCPSDKWACPACTVFNPKTMYYCDVCNKSRPDLQTLKF